MWCSLFTDWTLLICVVLLYFVWKEAGIDEKVNTQCDRLNSQLTAYDENI